MLRPSYTELMEKLNSDGKVDNKITSRYVIVIATAKRARQLIDGINPNPDFAADKVVSAAVNELYTGKINIRAIENHNMSTETGYHEGSDITE